MSSQANSICKSHGVACKRLLKKRTAQYAKLRTQKNPKSLNDRRDFDQHDTEAFTAFLYLHYTKLEAKKK